MQTQSRLKILLLLILSSNFISMHASVAHFIARDEASRPIVDTRTAEGFTAKDTVAEIKREFSGQVGLFVSEQYVRSIVSRKKNKKFLHADFATAADGRAFTDEQTLAGFSDDELIDVEILVPSANNVLFVHFKDGKMLVLFLPSGCDKLGEEALRVLFKSRIEQALNFDATDPSVQLDKFSIYQEVDLGDNVNVDDIAFRYYSPYTNKTTHVVSNFYSVDVGSNVYPEGDTAEKLRMLEETVYEKAELPLRAALEVSLEWFRVEKAKADIVTKLQSEKLAVPKGNEWAPILLCHEFEVAKRVLIALSKVSEPFLTLLSAQRYHELMKRALTICDDFAEQYAAFVTTNQKLAAALKPDDLKLPAEWTAKFSQVAASSAAVKTVAKVQSPGGLRKTISSAALSPKVAAAKPSNTNGSVVVPSGQQLTAAGLPIVTKPPAAKPIVIPTRPVKK